MVHHTSHVTRIFSLYFMPDLGFLFILKWSIMTCIWQSDLKRNETCIAITSLLFLFHDVSILDSVLRALVFRVHGICCYCFQLTHTSHTKGFARALCVSGVWKRDGDGEDEGHRDGEEEEEKEEKEQWKYHGGKRDVLTFVGGMRNTMNFKSGIQDENTMVESGMCWLT